MRRGALVLLPAALLASACFEGQRTIRVKADGSGAVVDTMVLGAQMKALLDGAGDDAGSAAKQKAKYEAAAAAMGPGVRFVGEEKTAEGLKATFAFTDVRTVKIDPAPGPAGDDEGGKKGQPLTFTLARQGARSVLTVIQPRPPAKEPSAAGASPDPMAQMASAMWTMMKPMMKGLKLRTVLEVDGTIAKTNSRLRSGSAVTLLEMDFDQIAADDANFRKFAAAGEDPATLDPRLLQGVKGIKVNPEPEVVVEFTAN